MSSRTARNLTLHRPRPLVLHDPVRAIQARILRNTVVTDVPRIGLLSSAAHAARVREAAGPALWRCWCGKHHRRAPTFRVVLNALTLPYGPPLFRRIAHVQRAARVRFAPSSTVRTRCARLRCGFWACPCSSPVARSSCVEAAPKSRDQQDETKGRKL
jgi:hypothetical protein